MTNRVLHSLAIVRFARHVNSASARSSELIDGLPGRPPPERWRKLAAGKIGADRRIDRPGEARAQGCSATRCSTNAPCWWNGRMRCMSRSRQDQEGPQTNILQTAGFDLERRSPFSIPDIHG